MRASEPTIAILAGGLATRLRPLTDEVPKALVPVAGQPFLAHQLALVRASGIRSVVLCVGYRGEMIEAQFGDGRAYGVALQYSYDGPELLGTGGALYKALPLLSDPFLVMYGDSYLRCNYAAIYDEFLKQRATHRPPPLGLMTVFHNAGQFDRSNVVFAEGRILVYDKHAHRPDMVYIDWGLSALTKEALAGHSAGEKFDLADVLRALVQQGRMSGYEVQERFYEIGSPEGLQELNTLMRDTHE
ncbi:MAG: nucleotidyltransferase family protein [bacterium]|nr:nucleotidyltransferase family protein [bacterium]